MSLNATVLFDRPQREVASLLRSRLDGCTSTSLVAGFMTVEGIETIAEPLREQPKKTGSSSSWCGELQSVRSV